MGLKKVTVDILVSTMKDSEGDIISCRIYNKAGGSLGSGQKKIGEDMMGATFKIDLNIKNVIKYIKNEMDL